MTTEQQPHQGSEGQDPPRAMHLYVLLDRSGSMAAIADDVIGGFNRLLAEQQADGADALCTLVQFDGQDPHEVVADAVPIREMRPLDATTFVPRSSTPLLDATGHLITHAALRAGELAMAGMPAEEIVLVSITDGHENASTELDLPAVRAMVDSRTEQGWTFVFLSAAIDVYGEAGGLGYDVRSSQAWSPDQEGTVEAFSSLSNAATVRRRKLRDFEDYDNRDFFEGDKRAEDDRRRRS